jgi:hypothetical protein
MLALPVWGEAAQPQYLTHLKGTVLTGLVQRETFDFNGGTLSNCQETVADDSLTTFDCDLTGAALQVGSGLSATFDKVWIAYATTPKATTHEYRFTSNWRDGSSNGLNSSLILDVWYDVTVPTDIKGSVGLSAYGVTGGIQASPVSP